MSLAGRLRALGARVRTPFGAAITLALVFGLIMGALPGFAGPGYEIALVTGIAIPSVVAIASAIDLGRRALSPFDAVCRGALLGALCFGATLAATLLHGALEGFCDPMSGLEIVVLGPGAGLLLAGVWGWIASEIARWLPKRRTALSVLFALAGPIGCIAASLVRYYSSPIIFAYDPFAGYFSGTLYDTVIEYGTLATYRLGSASSLLFTIAAAAHLRRDGSGRARPVWVARPGLFALGLVAALASVMITASGPTFGHWNTRSTIEHELGGRIEGERCIVVYSRSIDRARVSLFARECEAHVDLVEGWWGARGPEKITAFLFTSEGEKARLMGASGTNVAKPWRAEVYVQTSAFPHRVIGHEIMHVVAASHGQGPFAIAGDFGGWLPNPGLIEGVAVAASPKEDDLSAMQWAKSMKDLGILPRLESLFTLGFLGENSSMAYTVSGAFVGWVHDRYGAKTVREWYGGSSLEALTGKTLEELEALWHADLELLVLPESAQAPAKAKFDRPGFFARRCPRLVDACRGRARDLAASGDTEGALAELSRARQWESDNSSLLLEEASILITGPQPTKGVALYEQLVADDATPAYVRDRASEELGDYALKQGDVGAARTLFEGLVSRTIDEGKLRTLHVKIAATEDAALRPAIVTLLLGVGSRPPDRTAAAALLGALELERPDDGLPAYLLARYFADAEDYASAAAHLDRALSRSLDIPRVRLEALRLRLQVAVAQSDCEAASKARASYERESDVRGARLEAADRLVALCAALPKP